MQPIPEHLIEQIRESVNIVDLISRYVSLKKRGRNFVGLCPFHTEKTPSFSVNSEKQIFHCFGCGVGGNVFTFLMRHEKLGFVDAVRDVAREAGVEIPTSPEQRRQRSEQEILFSANQVAMSFFEAQINSAPTHVTSYLGQRGLHADTIKHFALGFAPEGWDGLVRQIEHFKYSVNPYKTLGLLLESQKSGKLYDRFRNRLIFPIHNVGGRVVGFGGRALDDDPKSPKYLNSPESPLYQKSRVLYGIYSAREAMREQGSVLVVEGYMDVIQLYQSGILNVVATSGTALTEAHAEILRRYTNTVILCYDADKAGINAALRGGQTLFQSQMDVQVLLLPEGEDPDSFVKAHGPEAFRELLGSASEYFTFLLDRLGDTYDYERASERSQAVSDALDAIAPMSDSIRSGFYLEKTGERLRLPVGILRDELKKKQFSLRKRSSRPVLLDTPQRQPEESGQEAGPLIVSGAWGAEKGVVLLLINFFSDIQEYVYQYLAADDFINPEFRDLFEFIGKKGADHPDSLLHIVLEKIDNDNLRSMLLRELEETNRVFEKPVPYLQDCIKKIKIARNTAEIDLARRELKDIQHGDKRFDALLQRLQKAMTDLKTWQDVVSSDE